VKDRVYNSINNHSEAQLSVEAVSPDIEEKQWLEEYHLGNSEQVPYQ
jgi:hypothetical protein